MKGQVKCTVKYNDWKRILKSTITLIFKFEFRFSTNAWWARYRKVVVYHHNKSQLWVDDYNIAKLKLSKWFLQTIWPSVCVFIVVFIIWVETKLCKLTQADAQSACQYNVFTSVNSRWIQFVHREVVLNWTVAHIFWSRLFLARAYY